MDFKGGSIFKQRERKEMYNTNCWVPSLKFFLVLYIDWNYKTLYETQRKEVLNILKKKILIVI